MLYHRSESLAETTQAASTYLSFSCYLKDEGHERNDGGGGDDEADPSGLLCQPHPLLLGIHASGVEGRPRPGQEPLDSAAAAALLGCHCFVFSLQLWLCGHPDAGRRTETIPDG